MLLQIKNIVNSISIKQNALAITLFIHIILLIIFNISQLSLKNKTTSNQEIKIEFIKEKEILKEQQTKTLPQSKKIITHIISNQDERYDIKKLRNSLKSIQKIDKVVDKNTDLFSEDAIKRVVKATTSLNQKENLNSKKQVYTGKSSISFSLKGRFQKYIPNPIYTCPNPGRVVVNISVNYLGIVTHCQINKQQTTTKDQCLLKTALKYSKKAQFTISEKEKQQGYISYDFQ